MLSNFKNLSYAALAIAAMALPGIAHAATNTATGAANLAVVSQCSVTGGAVNLGSFKSTDTWGDVSNLLGLFGPAGYVPGTAGQENLNFGSVTCDAGTPYSLTIKGSGREGTVQLGVNGKVVTFVTAFKKVGDVVQTDNTTAYVGAGRVVYASPATASGTGTPQAVLGSANLITSNYAVYGTTAALTDALGNSGAFSDTLNYTLTF